MSQKEIICLGTGAADTIKYFHTSFYIKEDNNSILVDTGGGAQIMTQLQKANISLEDIQYIFITHKHIDHILGLFWILRFLGSKISNGQTKKLIIFCSKNIEKVIKDISKMLLKEKIINLFDKQILFKNINNYMPIKIRNWQIVPFDTMSKKIEQFGFVLKFSNGVKMTYIGDEPYKGELYNQCKETDYFIHESFCLERDRAIYNPQNIHHSTVKEAAQAATKVNAKNVILFHSEDDTFGKRKKLYSQEASKYFVGKIFVPDDLDIIRIA